MRVRFYTKVDCDIFVDRDSAQASQFSLQDVEVITATCDLEEIRSYRAAPSRGLQAQHSPTFERIETPFSLSPETVDFDQGRKISLPTEIRYHLPEEEIAFGPACWLW